MTPEQKYLFDLTGYLKIPGVLRGADLARAQEAAQRYIDTPQDEVPDGFEINLERDHFNWYMHAFAFDKALEAITMSPATWPLILELTRGKPRLALGNMMVNRHDAPFHGLHSGGPFNRPSVWRYFVHEGGIYCSDLICFVYLTEVREGDGGFIAIPGSHKANFKMPRAMFYPGSHTDDGYNDDFNSSAVPPGVASFPVEAGDVILTTERVTHGALTWTPKDRDRRFLTLRYSTQYYSPSDSFPDGVKAKLSPETLELIQPAPFKYTKEIAKLDAITLS